MELADPSVIFDFMIRLRFISRLVEAVKELYPNSTLIVANSGDTVAGIYRKILEITKESLKVAKMAFLTFRGEMISRTLVKILIHSSLSSR